MTFLLPLGFRISLFFFWKQDKGCFRMNIKYYRPKCSPEFSISDSKSDQFWTLDSSFWIDPSSILFYLRKFCSSDQFQVWRKNRVDWDQIHGNLSVNSSWDIIKKKKRKLTRRPFENGSRLFPRPQNQLPLFGVVVTSSSNESVDRWLTKKCVNLHNQCRSDCSYWIRLILWINLFDSLTHSLDTVLRFVQCRY